MLANEVADVLQRTHGNQRDFARIPADEIGEEIDCRVGDGLRSRESLRPR